MTADHHHDHAQRAHQELRAKVLTVSDRVAAGRREDATGDALEELLESAGFDVVERRVCADGAETVANALAHMAFGFHGVIVTTGGTGFGSRDRTPEGTVRVLDRRGPGLAEAMRAVDPMGRLSRGVAGTRAHALILNVVGSTNGAIQMLNAVLDVLPHALGLMLNNDDPHPL